jgi:hypothetical protein
VLNKGPFASKVGPGGKFHPNMMKTGSRLDEYLHFYPKVG